MPTQLLANIIFLARTIPYYLYSASVCVLYPALASHQYVIDGNVDQFNKETNETHHEKADSNSACHGGKLLAVWFGAFLDQVHRIFCKLLKRLNQNLVDTFFLGHGVFVKRSGLERTWKRAERICVREMGKVDSGILVHERPGNR